MKCAKCLDIDFVQEARGCPACDPENYCPHGLTKTRTCGVCERAATVLEIAEAGESLIVTMKDKGSVASWLTIPLGTAPKPGKKEILDALWALLKEGAPK